MEVVKISKNKPDIKAINAALKILKQGGVLVYPTETAYALGCDWTNKKAKERIYKIKGREASKKLPVIVADLKMAKKYGKFDGVSESLAKNHWPGPLTIIVETRHGASPSSSVASPSSVAMRVSSNKIASLLTKKLNKPLVSTSANVSGKGNCYSAEEILNQFKKPFGKLRVSEKYKPDLILDVGKLRKVKSSTIVKIKNGETEVLRKGSVKI